MAAGDLLREPRVPFRSPPRRERPAERRAERPRPRDAAPTLRVVLNRPCDPGRRDSTGFRRSTSRSSWRASSRAAAADGPPLIDLGRGNPEVGPPPHVDRALGGGRRRGSRPRLPAVPRPAGTARGDRRAVQDAVRRGLSTQTPRSRSSPGQRPRSWSLRSSLQSAESAVLLPDPGYPDYPSGLALAAARLVPLPTRSGRGLGAGVGRRSSRGRRGRVPQLPVESLRRRRAARRLRSSRFDFARETGAADRARLRLRRPGLRRAPARRAFSRQPVRKRWASRCSRCRRPTGWPGGGSASCSATPRSWSGSICSRITPAPGSSPPSRKRESLRSPALRTPSRNGSRGTRRVVTASSTRCGPPACGRRSRKEASTSGSSSRKGSRWTSS